MIGVIFFTKNFSKIGCFGFKSTMMYKLLKGTFWKIQRIQIQIYPKTSIEPKNGEFYMKSDVSAHELVLLVLLS